MKGVVTSKRDSDIVHESVQEAHERAQLMDATDFEMWKRWERKVNTFLELIGCTQRYN